MILNSIVCPTCKSLESPIAEMVVYHTSFDCIVVCSNCLTTLYAYRGITQNTAMTEPKDVTLIPSGISCCETVFQELDMPHYGLSKVRIVRVCPYWQLVIHDQTKLKEEHLGGVFDPRIVGAYCGYLDREGGNEGILWDQVKICGIKEN